jgi:hypothetical protein
VDSGADYVGIGVGFASGGTLDLPQDVAAQFGAGAVLPHAFGVGDVAKGGAGADGGAGVISDPLTAVGGGAEIVSDVRAEAVDGGRGDRFELW